MKSESGLTGEGRGGAGGPVAALAAAESRRIAVAIGLMLLTGFCAVSMHTIVREVGQDMHPFEVAFFRFLIALPVMAPWILTAAPGTFRAERLRLHAIRSALNTAALLCFFTALTLAPLSQVVALNFTAPLFASVIAVVLLRERIGPRRVVGLLVGFGGMLVILRPDLGVSLGAVLTLCASLFWASAMAVIKVLGRTESSLATTVYASVFITLFAAPAAALYWQWPSWRDLGLLAVAASLGTISQVAMTQAFRQADVGLLMPFDFSKLIWASVYGFLIFSEIPDAYALAGGALIIGSISYIAYRESRAGGAPHAPESGRH